MHLCWCVIYMPWCLSACAAMRPFSFHKPAIVGLLWIGLLWHFPRSALLSVIRVKECHACLHICIVTAIVIHICHNVIDGFAWLALTDHDCQYGAAWQFVVVAYFYVATIIVGTMFPRWFAGLSGPILVQLIMIDLLATWGAYFVIGHLIMMRRFGFGM